MKTGPEGRKSYCKRTYKKELKKVKKEVIIMARKIKDAEVAVEAAKEAVEEKVEEVKAAAKEAAEELAAKAEEASESVKEAADKAAQVAEQKAPKTTRAAKKAGKAAADTAAKAGKAANEAKAKAKKAVKDIVPVRETYIQFFGKDIMAEDIVKQIEAAYKAEGHRVSSIHSLRTYINVAEGRAYYVINDKEEGKYIQL